MDKRRTRSVRIRRYEAVYNEYIKNKKEFELKEKSKDKVKKEKGTNEELDLSKKKKHSLSTYQKFVKKESQKEKYKGMKADERMSKIARAWKKIEKAT